METFKYKVIVFGLTSAVALEEQLNDMGMQGWELITIQDVKITQLLIFKRKI